MLDVNHGFITQMSYVLLIIIHSHMRELSAEELHNLPMIPWTGKGAVQI